MTSLSVGTILLLLVELSECQSFACLTKTQSQPTNLAGVNGRSYEFSVSTLGSVTVSSVNHIVVWIKCNSSAIIGLSSSSSLTSPNYAIAIGSFSNTETFAQYCSSGFVSASCGSKLASMTHSPLTPGAFTPFWIAWKESGSNTSVSVGSGSTVGSGQAFFTFNTNALLSVNCVLVGSVYTAYQIMFEEYSACTTTEAKIKQTTTETTTKVTTTTESTTETTTPITKATTETTTPTTEAATETTTLTTEAPTETTTPTAEVTTETTTPTTEATTETSTLTTEAPTETTTPTAETTTETTTPTTAATTETLTPTAETTTETTTPTTETPTTETTTPTAEATTPSNPSPEQTTLKTTTTGSVPLTSKCCRCLQRKPSTISGEEQEKFLEEFKEDLAKQLIVRVQNTSAAIRKKISVPDGRPSSAMMGTLGIVCVCVPLVGMLIADMVRVILQISHRKMCTTNN